MGCAHLLRMHFACVFSLTTKQVFIYVNACKMECARGKESAPVSMSACAHVLRLVEVNQRVIFSPYVIVEHPLNFKCHFQDLPPSCLPLIVM